MEHEPRHLFLSQSLQAESDPTTDTAVLHLPGIYSGGVSFGTASPAPLLPRLRMSTRVLPLEGCRLTFQHFLSRPEQELLRFGGRRILSPLSVQR